MTKASDFRRVISIFLQERSRLLSALFDVRDDAGADPLPTRDQRLQLLSTPRVTQRSGAHLRRSG